MLGVAYTLTGKGKREKNQRKEKYLITQSVCEGLFFPLYTKNCSLNTVQLENNKYTGV